MIRLSRLLVAAIPLLVLSACASTHGGRVVTGAVRSEMTGGRTADYAILLPPGYTPGGTRRYPVLYWLHDGFGHPESLVGRGVVQDLWRRMASGELPAMIIACPAGRGSFYTNNWDGSRRYGDHVAVEFREMVEMSYPVRTDRGGRAISGISMGGFGAMRAAVHFPELWSSVSSLSGALTGTDYGFVEAIPFFVRPLTRKVFGPSADRNKLAEDDAVTRLAADPTLVARFPPSMIRIGDDDDPRLLAGNERAAKGISAAGATVEFSVDDGGHDWGYWRRVFPEIAAFAAKHFTPLPGEGR